MTPRLKELYIKEIQPALKTKFGLKNLYISGIELGSNHRLEKSYNFLNEIECELFSHNYFPDKHPNELLVHVDN